MAADRSVAEIVIRRHQLERRIAAGGFGQVAHRRQLPSTHKTGRWNWNGGQHHRFALMRLHLLSGELPA